MITITIETNEDETNTTVDINGKGRDIKEEITIFATEYADILNTMLEKLPIKMKAEILMAILENRKDDTCR